MKLQLNALKARGESSNDIMVNLYKGYKVITDTQFKQYISQKINNYDEGVQLDEDCLMVQSEYKYKNLVWSGEWKSPLEDQKGILAMKANTEWNKKGSKAKKHEWKKKAPSDPKEVKKNNGHWLPKHTMCNILKPEECRLPKDKEVQLKEEDSKPGEEGWKIAKALLALQEADGSIKMTAMPVVTLHR